MNAPAGLPKVKIYATGGTIAGASSSSTDNLYYKAGSIGIEGLLDAVPEIHQIADVSGEQFLNVGSHEVTSRDLLTLSKRIQTDLNDDAIRGVIVTHGTDTLEETAFFLDLTIQSDKPVVVVGAMRPATAISADGPLNLLQATALAAHPDSRSRGVMIVLSDRIQSAFYTSKTHANALDTFRASEQGSLGFFQNITPHFYYTAATPTSKKYIDISNIASLARVDIIYSHQDATADALHASIEKGARGIVISAAGNGWASPALEHAAVTLTQQNYPIVFSTRTGSGFASKPLEQGISANLVNAQKARILLMLGIEKSSSLAEIQALFR